MATVDIEQLLIEQIAAATGFGVSGEVPADLEHRLPYVQITGLSALPAHRPFNGPALTDRHSVDVDVFAATPEACFDAAASVRAAIESWTHPRVSVETVPQLSKRPDWNPAVRRRGAVAVLLTR